MAFNIETTAQHSKPQYQTRMQLWSACLGNFFDHYDTALFGFLSAFLAPFFFPEEDQLTALILTYAMIPLGMLARPFGALVFGYIGDLYGRKQALFLSLGGMAIVSGCMVVSPTYQQVGLVAPIIFCVGRIIQNFLASGEVMGGAIYLLENTPEKHHDMLSSIYSATTIGGILFASAGVSFIYQHDAVTWEWRLLYLLGCITALFGFIVRRRLPSKTWEDNFHLKPTQSVSKLLTNFWDHRKSLLLIVITSGFAYATYSIALILMNGFVPLISSITNAEMMTLNTYLLIFDFCALPVFGWVSLKISREKLMLIASLSAALSGLPLFMLLPHASLMGIVAIRIFLVILGVAFFAPFHAWAQQLVPSTCRYGVISFGYAVGSQLLGAPTAMLSLWTFKQTGIVSSVVWYWLILAVASSVAVMLSMKAKQEIESLKEAI